MRKIVAVFLAVVFCAVLMTGCCLKHTWQEANCEQPRHCAECGKTEGEALGHQWKEATCEEPKTCEECEKTEGEPVGHQWQDATCEVPATCEICGESGEMAEHQWQDATITEPMTCKVCGQTRGDSLPMYDDETIFMDCDTYVELFAQKLKNMGYVILEWEGEKPENPIRNFEIFEVDNPTGIMTLVLPYDPETSNVICLNFLWEMEREELEMESEVGKYTGIVVDAYEVLCPEGMDNDLQLQIYTFVGRFEALITPVNASLDSIEW